MKLAEKIQLLRKKYGYSQEYLAEICNVSRQAISKWEAGITYPEIGKLIILSNLFNVSIDILTKDELKLDVNINNTCHKTIQDKSKGYFEGILIKESICDENILDILNIHKTELWKTDSYPKYWTALYFTSSDMDLADKFSKVMIADDKLGGNWYVDFKHNNMKYIVFKNKILSYEIGNKFDKDKINEECKKLGIDISDVDE